MQKNILEIAGNLAEDATVSPVGTDRQVLKLRVVTSRTWIDKVSNEEKSDVVGHEVVRFGKVGQFDNFLPYLKKGQGIFAEGTFEKTYSPKNEEGNSYLNNQINASFGGDIQLINSTGSSINIHRIGGFLASDAVIRKTSKGEALAFTIMTTNSWGTAENQSKTYAHDIVQFGEAGKFTKVAELLKKGAGVYVKGIVEKTMNEPEEGKKYLNVVTNASFERIYITKYTTPKPGTENEPAQQAPAQQAPAQQAPAQQAPAQQEPAQQEPAQQAPAQQAPAQQAPAQQAPTHNEPSMDFDDDIPF